MKGRLEQIWGLAGCALFLLGLIAWVVLSIQEHWTTIVATISTPFVAAFADDRPLNVPGAIVIGAVIIGIAIFVGAAGLCEAIKKNK